MRPRIVRPTIVCALLAGSLAGAQVPGRVPLRGVVFDSVRGRPIRDAFVTIAGSAQSALTDSRGRFHFDSVLVGTRTISVQHSELDSLGLTGLSRTAVIGPSDDEFRVAVPSFATIWRRLCNNAPVPEDSGIVFGTVRDAHTKAPIANARVKVSWTELTMRTLTAPQHWTGFRKVPTEVPWSGEVRTNESGTYAVCDAPRDEAIHLAVSTDSGASGSIELPIGNLRVRHRDLFIGAMRGGKFETGVVEGLLADPDGAPFVDARVTIGDSIELRSDFDGRVVFPSVPVGTRQVTIRYVGTNPLITTVDVIAGDTSRFMTEIPRVTKLATTFVTSPERARMLVEEYEERKISYHRYMIDTTEIKKLDATYEVFLGRPNITMKRRGADFTIVMPDGRGGSCVPELRLDGVMANDFGQLNAIPPNRIVSVELYTHFMDMPPEYQRGGVVYPCGLVAVWTKWAFRIP